MTQETTYESIANADGRLQLDIDLGQRAAGKKVVIRVERESDDDDRRHAELMKMLEETAGSIPDFKVPPPLEWREARPLDEDDGLSDR